MALCFIVIVPAAYFISLPKVSENILGPTANPEEPNPDLTISSSNFNILMAGTTFWGRNTNKMARNSSLGVKYPFSGLYTLGRDNYDAWIAGLECPITSNGHTDYNENTLLKFNCDPDYLPEAAKWFTAFSLGNNHTDNWGAAGFATTKQNLDKASIQHFGHYDYRNTTEICAPIIIPTHLTYDNGTENIVNLPIGFCGIHGVYAMPTEAALQEIKRFSAILPTIVMPHMGAEYKPSADPLRTSLYRKIIDYGAEMVIGDHPHWVQNTEAYKGHLIVYSMGNFMFDQLWSNEVILSAAIAASATVNPDTDFGAWDTVANACIANRDTCLDGIKDANLPRLTIDWNFAYHGTTTANTRITRLADPATNTAIGKRLNWDATMNNL